MAENTADNTALAPITQERVEAQLDAFDLKYFRGDDGNTRTAFPGLVCFFEFTDAGCKISSRWLGTAATPEDIETLRETANQLNRIIPLVRTHPILRSDDTAVAIIEAPLFATVGVTDEQLRQMLEFYFSSAHHVKGELKEALPHIDDSLTEPESEA